MLDNTAGILQGLPKRPMTEGHPAIAPEFGEHPDRAWHAERVQVLAPLHHDEAEVELEVTPEDHP